MPGYQSHIKTSPPGQAPGQERSGHQWQSSAEQCSGVAPTNDVPVPATAPAPLPASLPILTFSMFGFKQFPAQHGLSTVRSEACIFLMKKFLLVRVMRMSSYYNEGERIHYTEY